uniref:Agrin n=1 Tax=Phallusia mammillata TaxID=59560 RepID=A0A6F9D5B5_9ASCI|nr:agrin [Phallusia mammillata]
MTCRNINLHFCTLWDLSKNFCAIKSLAIVVLCIAHLSLGVDAGRFARGVMLSMPGKRATNCLDQTTIEKNATSKLILTATVEKCDGKKAGSYKCSVQIWRIMKGQKFAQDLITSKQHGAMGLVYKQKFVNIYGLGNIMYCDSDVNKEDTRIFFVNRINNRLVLSASVVHITLTNLENTQAVIEGKSIVEPPKKKPDPCMNVLCGYGASCQVAKDGNATCLCPDLSCSSGTEEDELFAPLCGSDGITYPNECRLKAAQCMAQRRIRIAEEKPCAPVVNEGLCADVQCGNSAECVVRIQPDSTLTPSCVCPTCNDVPATPLCGSDQVSYRSECDLRRASCLKGSEITVVRPLACNPCEVFNGTSQEFENTCPGICSLGEDGSPVCCDTFPCPDDGQLVCGNDGNSYASECALRRHACKTGRSLSVLQPGLCPLKKLMTTVRGSVGIKADSQCPGDCDPETQQFQKFVEDMEAVVNGDLQNKNFDSPETLTLGEFTVTGSRPGSVVLIFKAYASTRSLVINSDDPPDSNTAWIYKRLFDPINGAIINAVLNSNVSFVEDREPMDDFIVEDVCLLEQCSHGARCEITIGNSELQPMCSCNGVGNSDYLPVTHACKLATDGAGATHTFVNMQAAHKFACNAETQLTFQDVCQGDSEDPCASQGGCRGEGQSCVIINGGPVCECITCNDVYKPVCTVDGQTFRSECEVQRHNCLSFGNLVIARHDGPCVSECDGVTCAPGEQCEVNNNGAVCVCPTTCIAAISPVCGTDGVTYDNECELVVAACKSRSKVTMQYMGPCDDRDRYDPSGEGSGGDGCNCNFGAVCVTTLDDEDSSCVCDIRCTNSPPGEVCGSDGKTYANACELIKAQCKKQKTIKVVYNGSCAAACLSSRYGCCEDGVTAAKGLQRSGCPEKCNCNEFGSYETTCNQTTGQCVCRPGVGGVKCDRCLPGYWNFVSVANKQISGCMSCRCNPLGSIRDDCDQMTGRCSCKENVSGTKCTHCMIGGVETWITNDLCETGTQSPKSCGELSCRAGQECVENVDGLFECRCPTLASCNSFLGGSVCGSNGITYADECQMRVITCKEGIDVSVASEGPCIRIEPLVKITTTPKPEPEQTTTQTTTITTTEPIAVPEPTTTKAPTTPKVTPEPEPEPVVTEKSTTTMKTTTTFQPSPEPTMEPEPEPESKPEPVMSSTTSTESKSTPATTTTVVMSTSSAPVDLTSTEAETGSGCMGDDEDGCKEGSGGDEEQPMTSTEKIATTMASTKETKVSTEEPAEKPTQAPSMFNGTADFYRVDGQRTYYSPDLEDSSSELFAEYSNIISSEVMALAAQEPLHGKVMTFSIKSFKSNVFFLSTGVIATFELGLAPGSDPVEIQDSLNQLSGEEYNFQINIPTGQENLLVHDWPFPPLDGAEDLRDGYSMSIPDFKRVLISSPVPKSVYEEDTEWTIPQFGGASYAEFRSIAAVTSTTIEMRFRSFDSEGLLFYAGTSDFISLAINKGYLEFRFDTGSGALKLRSKRPLDDGEWHSIVARRNRREGMLQIDNDGNPVHGTSPGPRRGLNLDSNVYIGGFVSVDRILSTTIQNQVGVDKGLTGCVHSVSIDNSELVLNSSSRNCINARRIAECGSSPCFPSKCRNSANCFITKQGDIFTNKCQCKGLFEGPTCEQPVTKKPKDPCIAHQCHLSSTCVRSENGDGYTCVCPPGRSGSLCMDSELDLGGPGYMPAFAEDSYLQFEPLSSDVASSMSVEVLFYSSQPDGLIFYNDQQKEGKSRRDLVALNLKDGYLVYMYDLGQGLAKIRSASPVGLNEWHVVRLSRENRHGEMSIDNGPTVQGTSPKARTSVKNKRKWYMKHWNLHSELNVDQPLYLGGVPDYTKIPKATGITTGLVGALQKFEVNGISLSLTPGGGVAQWNVQPFNAHACYHKPCENGGTCYPRKAEFTCLCAEGYAGSRCDERASERTSSVNVLRDEAASAVYFDGKVVAMYRNAVKEKSRATRHNRFELVIRTTARHGLLLMAGKAIDNHDYLAVTISDGRVHLRFNLGSGPAHLISEERINDNSFHTIKVDRKFAKATLSVDNGIPQEVVAQGNTRELNTDGNVWIGGVDYRPRGVGLYKSFFHSFVGCVSTFKIHGEVVSFKDDALNTPSLRSCRDR